jgi:hypothetical protein
MAKKKTPVPEFYLYSDGAQKKLQHQQEKQQLNKLRKQGEDRPKTRVSRA